MTSFFLKDISEGVFKPLMIGQYSVGRGRERVGEDAHNMARVGVEPADAAGGPKPANMTMILLTMTSHF